MRNLLKILLAGTLIFMVLAIGQEWEFFSTSWLGNDEKTVEMTDEDRQEAVDSVYLMLNLMRHLYSSDGDPRFADRMPVSEAVLREMLDDVEYLVKNQRRQDPELMRLEIRSVEPVDERRVQVHTRELWIMRLSWLTGTGESEPPHSQVLYGKYLVMRGSQGWQVEAWDFDEPVGEEGPSPS